MPRRLLPTKPFTRPFENSNQLSGHALKLFEHIQFNNDGKYAALVEWINYNCSKSDRAYIAGYLDSLTTQAGLF